MYSKRAQFAETINYLSDLFNAYEYQHNLITSSEFYHEVNDPNSLWYLNIVDIEITEFDKILNIIDKILKNESTYLQYISYIKTYITNILNKVKTAHDDIRGWRYRFPEMCPEIYIVEEDIMLTLKNLLELMKMSPFELFEMMKSCEKISLRNICFENKIPYDIERFTSGFIGFA